MADTEKLTSALSRALRPFIVAVFAAFIACAGLFTAPPLDRDESRFAQATAQMLETGDFIAIRFQDDERNKKPAGIHWLQAASVSLFSSVEAREIWAYRLPSTLALIIASVAAYFIGARLFGREAGFLGALLLAAAPGAAAEAMIAKTDAALLAAVCLAQAALVEIYARTRDGAPIGWTPALFWGALGAGVLLKGPIAPMIVGFTLAAMAIRDRGGAWIAALRPVAGLAGLVLMLGPWLAAIGMATDGRFFTEAIGRDMLGKLGAAQESHAGPPGYHFVLAAALMWPAAGLLIPGLLRAIATRGSWPSFFLLAWLVPSWVVFELTATKLPHYTLPLLPALALLAARAASVGEARRRKWARKFGAGLYFVIAVAFAGLIFALPYMLAAPDHRLDTAPQALLILAGAGVVAALWWRGGSRAAPYGAAMLSAAFIWIALGGVLPKLEDLRVSPNISDALAEHRRHPLRDGAPDVAIAGYAEPSAVFLLGTGTKLAKGAAAADWIASPEGQTAIVEQREDAAFLARLAALNARVEPLARIDGINYSNGARVNLTVYGEIP